MSPQPANPESANNGPTTEAERQIERAKALEGERASLGKKIAANREYLRLMAANDALTSSQQAWLERFYPTKEKGERRSKEDIEATRKVKQEARTPVAA